MERTGHKEFADEIVEKAKELGACLAGIGDVSELRRSPSHVIYSKLDSFKGIGTKESKGIAQGEFAWPQRARSIIVLAIPHPRYKPELDWWMEGCRGGTPGNQMLISINDGLSKWLEEKKGVETKKLPYYIEQGGVFLKDAAAMAGLGCIGKNNLFLTPEFGPEVRLRALFTYLKLPSTGPLEFHPCKECDMPCRRVCPQDAFASKKYSRIKWGSLTCRAGTAFTIAICAMRRWNRMWPKAKGLLLKEAKRLAGWSAIAEDANWRVRLARERSINAESAEIAESIIRRHYTLRRSETSSSPNSRSCFKNEDRRVTSTANLLQLDVLDCAARLKVMRSRLLVECPRLPYRSTF